MAYDYQNDELKPLGAPDTSYGGGRENNYGPKRSEQDAGYFRGQAEQAQGRAPTQVYGTGMNTYLDREAQARQQQNAALEQQRAIAEGRAPTQAMLLGRQQQQQAAAMQTALAGSARGAQALAMAGQNAAANSAATRQQIGTSMVANRAAEMEAARDAYAQGAMGMRTADQAAVAAQQQRMLDQARMNAAQRSQNDAYASQMYGNEVTINNAQSSADTARYQSDLQRDVGGQQNQVATERQVMEDRKAVVSAAATGVGMMMSDARTKVVARKASSRDVADLVRSFDAVLALRGGK